VQTEVLVSIMNHQGPTPGRIPGLVPSEPVSPIETPEPPSWDLDNVPPTAARIADCEEASVAILHLAEGDADEDLTECISLWQGSGHVRTPEHPWVSIPCSPGKSWQQVKGDFHVGASAKHVMQQQQLSVNVGGIVFDTTVATLRKSTFFDTLLKHKEEGTMKSTIDHDGVLFVDRSGQLFIYILEFLRCGHWMLKGRGEDKDFVAALQEEANFYGVEDQPIHQLVEYATVWQFLDDTCFYVDCLEQTIREDPDHQGLFRLCKYFGGFPLDTQTCTRRFKATTSHLQSVIAYFALRGFVIQSAIERSLITHTTSADGQGKSGSGVQYILVRKVWFASP